MTEISESVFATRTETLHASCVVMDRDLVNDFSISLASDELLNLISKYVTLNLSLLSPFLLNNDFVSSESLMKFSFTEYGAQVCRIIMQFFYNARIVWKLTGGEIIHTFFLYDSLILNEYEGMKRGRKSDVCIENLGIVLLCAFIISLKMTRDSSFTNKLYHKYFRIPLKLLKTSEINFLKKIKYRCNLSEQHYQEFCSRFFPLLSLSPIQESPSSL
jgi:hypothetical protein